MASDPFLTRRETPDPTREACLTPETIPSEVFTQAPGFPAQPCDPPAPETSPEVFTAPPPPPPQPPEPPENPPAFQVANREFTKTCADIPGAGPVGAAQTVAANTIIEEILAQDIPRVTESQLRYMAGLPSELFSGDVSGLSPSALTARFGILGDQADWLAAQLQTAQARVDAAAEAAALVGLQCVWLSAPQTKACPPGAVAGEANPVTIVAGAYQSTVSQADADALAAVAALAALRCVWRNTAQTAACSPAVPNDETPVYPGQPLRVGSVTVAAGTVESTVGQADADATALSLASAQLVCLYPNARVSKSCPAGADGSPADPVSGVSGNSVVIPEGFFFSAVSQAEAQAQAVALADSLLDCFWWNTAQTAKCEPQTITDPATGKTRVVPADPRQGRPDVSVDARTIRSEVSREDANTTAKALAQAQLSCVYCNLSVPPKCQTPGSIEVSKRSLDETAGVLAGVFCGPDAQSVQVLAESVGNLPLDILIPGEGCTYGNDEMTFTCLERPGVDFSKFPGDTQIDTETTGGLSRQSFPDPLTNDVLFIAANTIIVRDTDAPTGVSAKDYANALARAQGFGMMNCFFVNGPAYGGCGGGETKEDYALRTKQFPDLTVPEGGTPRPAPGTDPDFFGSHGAVAAGSYTSYLSFYEAQTQAQTAARAMTVCLYGNGEQKVSCESEDDSGLPTLETATVAPNTTQADTVERANIAARALAVALCDLKSQAKKGKKGAPGNDGPQSNCEGNCFGYYS